jgi:hypothetical protein
LKIFWQKTVDNYTSYSFHRVTTTVYKTKCDQENNSISLEIWNAFSLSLLGSVSQSPAVLQEMS